MTTQKEASPTTWTAPTAEARRVAALAPGERERVTKAEIFGLRPFDKARHEARRAIFGHGETPATDWGLSTHKIFKPQISFPTWLGRRRPDRRVPIYNFFNHNRTGPDEPYSVRVERCRDYRGRQWTYDSHAGTDLAVACGTPVVTGAPGKVIRVACELDRGGLKVCIDHGGGLFTTSSHLARALVSEGDLVGRGQIVGVAGASGIEFLLGFPWVSPHVHYNTWLNGEPADPFAADADEPSLWRHHNDPRPHDPGDPGDARDDDPGRFEPSDWDPDGVDAAIAACRNPEIRDRAASFDELERRAAEVLFFRVEQAASFAEFPPLYRTVGERRPVLDLPFRHVDFVGVALPRGY